MASLTMRMLIAFALIPLLIVSFVPSCTSPATDIKVSLAFSEPPVLNKPVIITETFTLRKNFPSSVSQNINAHIILPDGFEKVDGDLEWSGSISQGETKTLSATVKSTRFGSFQVYANAGWPGVNPNGAAGIKELYITVSEKGATVSDQIPTANATFVTPASPRTPYPFEKPATTIHIPTIEPGQKPTPSYSQAPATDIKVDLDFSEPPILNKPV